MDDPGCESINSWPSTIECPCRPQIRHATVTIPPMRKAPPIPTTTPITIRFWSWSKPDLPESPSLVSRLGFVVEVAEEVEAGSNRFVVYTLICVLLPLTATTVVINCCVRLLTDLDSALVALDASVEIGPRGRFIVDWTSAGGGLCAGRIVSWSPACELDGSAFVEAGGNGLSFANSLVVCTSTVGGSNTELSSDDEVSSAENGVELVAARLLDVEAVTEAPVPMGTFCRY